MPIWKSPAAPDVLMSLQRNTLAAHIGMRITEVGDDYVRGTLPVDARTHQPFGRLHGGASVALAEELGSLAANMCLDPRREYAFGLDINANHVRGVTAGVVTGTARPLHLGGSTQVWEIRIENERRQLVCVSRLTMAVLQREGGEDGGGRSGGA
jgi:1,4-dihydroxy-2-naphthoyl-CoA hydrolase